MSLTEIYRQHRRTLERYVRRLLGNSDDAADVSQEAFLRAYSAELGGSTPLSEALLYTTARNLALSELRKRTTRATDALADMDEIGAIAPNSCPQGRLQEQQMVQAVQAAIERMPPRCQEVFRLRKIEQRSHAEIATALGISTKTVERHISHALRLCHAALAELPQQPGQRSRGAPP